MKSLVGKEITVYAEGMGLVKGKLLMDKKDMIILGGGDKMPGGVAIIKSKIVGFSPPEIDSNINLLVLACTNPTIGCPGVKYVKNGKGFSQNDFNAFMNPCPVRCDTCRSGSLGEIRSLEPEVMAEMVEGTLYGDYPEEKEKK